MGRIKSFLTERLFGSAIREHVSAGIAAEVKRLPASISSRVEDTGWRKLTADENRNLDPLSQDRMIDIAFALWESNPLAKWIIEVIKDFILSEGVPFDSPEEDVNELLEEFWYDPLNRLDLYAEKHARELHIFGELCFPVFTAQQTGRVRLGYIDPKEIDTVETDPENAKLAVGVILKSKNAMPPKKYRIILPEEAEEIISANARTMRQSYTDGEVLYFAVNNVSNSPRGRSELLTTADWLDAYEQFLFDYADKWPLLNTFVWDLLVKGGDAAGIDAQVKAFTKKSGSVYGHNENVELKASTPELKSVEANEGAKLFRNHILGGHGFPSFWFGGGEGEQGRALGVEMGAPAYRMLDSKQRYFKFVLETIFDLVIDRAMKARYLTLSEDRAYNYSINLPELVQRDIAKFSAAIQQLSASIMTAQTQGWLDKENAIAIFAFAMKLIGYELDVEDVKKAVDKEEKDREAQDYRNRQKPDFDREGREGVKTEG